MTKHLIALFFITCAIALCEDPNPRSVVAGYGYGTLPHIADGGYWKTSIVLVNLENTRSTWKVELFGDNGAPKEFTFAGWGRATVLTGVLDPSGTITLETLGGTGELNQGWARVSSDYKDIGAMVIFGTSGIPNRLDFEASIPASRLSDHDTMIPYDNTNGYVTSIAILNPDRWDATIDVYLLDERGLTIKVPERVLIKPGQKGAFATTDVWPFLKGRRGTIFIDERSGNVVSLALRFHPGGAFTTVFPMSTW